MDNQISIPNSVNVPASFKPIPLGTFLKPIGIERLKLNTGQSVICSIITLQAWPAVVHYDPDMRLLFHCFKGKCCAGSGKPQERYVIPVLCYTGNKDNYGPPYTIKYYSMGNGTYKRLCGKQNLCKDLYHREINTCDLEITCENGEYQNFNFEVIGAAKYMQLEPNYGRDLVQQLMTDWDSLLYTSIANPITPERYDELKKLSLSRESMSPQAQMGNTGGYQRPAYQSWSNAPRQARPQQYPAGHYAPQQQYGGVPQQAPQPVYIPPPQPTPVPQQPQAGYQSFSQSTDSGNLNGVDIDGLIAQPMPQRVANPISPITPNAQSVLPSASSIQQHTPTPQQVPQPSPQSVITQAPQPAEGDPSDPFEAIDSTEDFESMI